MTKGISQYQAPPGIRGAAPGGLITLFKLNEMDDKAIDRYGLRKYIHEKAGGANDTEEAQ